MSDLFDVIRGLTTEAPTSIDKSMLAQTFARELGWTPSYNLLPSNDEDFVNMHLVVEHGLENSAVLSFLKTPYTILTEPQRKSLLTLSYNNLVDWHIHIDKDKATFVYNRNAPSDNIIQESPIRKDYYDELRSDAFEKLIGKKRSPNIPALDDALISTISIWKRNISAELNNSISNDKLSSLFNSIIFIRALEDNTNRYKGSNSKSKILFEAWEKYKGKKNFTGVIAKALEILGRTKIPTYLLQKKNLTEFDALDRQTISYLINDFYHNRVANFYSYDFSIMSKHALSRVYERYAAILKVEETDQLTLFPTLPQEHTNKAFGTVYTPQYIARFFGRYLKQNLPPSLFSKITMFEPSVGSGIFLRSILEIKCDPRIEENSKSKIKAAFQDVVGIDIDANACQAARLSLALLQLVLTDDFPEKLNVTQHETILFLKENPRLKDKFDVVVSNPPFIATELLSTELKERIIEFLGEYSKGRPDAYLAFLKGGIDVIKPGGFGMYVLPHSFLISDSATKLRKYLFDNCWVRCLADLSAVPVFGNTGIYVILLIFQKKTSSTIPQNAVIVKCRELVGRALQDAISNKFVDNPFYSVFEVEQSFFNDDSWTILPYKELKIKEKLSSFPKLSEFLDVRQGFVTGADDIFILDKNKIPVGEEALYIPYLPDKQIDRYSNTKQSGQYLFYPFIKDEKIDEKALRKNYPITWKYLQSKKAQLVQRKSFAKNIDWWRPLRTRQPEHLLVPKIITPHLTIMPKFTIDINGRFGVSRSPFLIPKVSTSGEKDLLLYFLAILNSTPCYWHISNHSHKYSQGYTMIEVKTLDKTPVPDPSKIPINDFRKIIALVNERLKCSGVEALKIENKIDEIVCNLYNLTSEDKIVFGVNGANT